VQLDNTEATNGSLPPPGRSLAGVNTGHPNHPTGINVTTDTMQRPSGCVARLHRECQRIQPRCWGGGPRGTLRAATHRFPTAMATRNLQRASLFRKPNGRTHEFRLGNGGTAPPMAMSGRSCTNTSPQTRGVVLRQLPVVTWTTKMASKKSRVAAQLVRALALRLNIKQSCPITPVHIPGIENVLTDIPSRSLGSIPEWHCTTNNEFLTLFNSQFPLPNQASWTYSNSTQE